MAREFWVRPDNSLNIEDVGCCFETVAEKTKKRLIHVREVLPNTVTTTFDELAKAVAFATLPNGDDGGYIAMEVLWNYLTPKEEKDKS